jgi:hypothetical protein
MNKQMKMWRKAKKDKQLVIEECNNLELTDILGNKVYILVIQPYDDAEAELHYTICPMGLNCYSDAVLVSGYTYQFHKKENRDAVYAYVMK